MHQTTITGEEFTILQGRLDVFGRSEANGAQVTVGKHPDFGSIVVTRLGDDRLLLWSEHPYAQAKPLEDAISVAA